MKSNKTVIEVSILINASIEEVWSRWTTPEDILKWNNASEDWHTTKAENDLRTGGHFLSRMEAKDGSLGFDFTGIYDLVKEYKYIEYTIADGRKVSATFETEGRTTKITELFEAEEFHTAEQQFEGWQAILNNFRNYVETSKH